jgi:4-hydroxy-2-oxoheptanedioate aldolase
MIDMRAPDSRPSLRSIWSSGAPTFGAWLSIPSSVSAEAVARCDFDYVCIDGQHGAVDYQRCVEMIQGIVLAGNVPLVRVPWNEPGVIGRMLDAGAEGVIVPMVNSAAEAAALVHAARYPPEGMRSYGPVMVGMRVGNVIEDARARIAVIPMIETRAAVERIDEILAVPGIDAIYVGPADLSLSLGLPPQNNDGEAAFDDALATIVAACRRHGVVPGMHTVASLVARRLEQGFQLLTVAAELPILRAAMTADLTTARAAQRASTSATSSSARSGSMY